MEQECDKCGVKLQKDAKFCHVCGHSQDSGDQPEVGEPEKSQAKSTVVQMSKEQFDEFAVAMAKNIIDQTGMTKVDRKHFAFEGLTNDEVDKLDGKQKMVKLVRSLISGDIISAKALSEGTDSAGGYLVPTEFRAEIIKGLEKPGTVRSLVRTIPVGRDTGEIPTVAGNVTVQWGAENTTITASDATFGQVTWNINRLDGLNKASRELFADSAINLGDLLVQLFTEAFVREERNVFITGNGSGKPQGLQNASGTIAASQAGGSLAGDDIVGFYHSLASQYRASAVWIINDSVLEIVAKLKDNDGRYLLNDSLAQGQPQTIKGRPVFENEFIPTNLGGGGDESLIFFGNPMWYYLFDRQEMGVEVSNEAGTAFADHQTWTKVFERLDGKLSLGESFVKATGIK